MPGFPLTKLFYPEELQREPRLQIVLDELLSRLAETMRQDLLSRGMSFCMVIACGIELIRRERVKRGK